MSDSYPLWFVSVGQPCFSCPLWTGWFPLFGRVGTSSVSLGRAQPSEKDIWKREAVLHRCCHPTQPWGVMKTEVETVVYCQWAPCPSIRLCIFSSFCINCIKSSLLLCKCYLWFLQRRDFEQQKASFMKQQYLFDSPLFSKEVPSNNRRESTALSEYCWRKYSISEVCCSSVSFIKTCRHTGEPTADLSRWADPGKW